MHTFHVGLLHIETLRLVGCLRCATILLASTANTIKAHPFLEHSHAKTFLKTTGLARFTPTLVNFAVVGSRTRVLDVSCVCVCRSIQLCTNIHILILTVRYDFLCCLTLNGALEEGLARLARGDAIVKARGRVTAYQTQPLGRRVSGLVQVVGVDHGAGSAIARDSA